MQETVKPKRTPKRRLISDYRAMRRKLDLIQGEFWGRVGVTQSGGSRFESKWRVPKPVAVLAYAVYVDGVDVDARGFKCFIDYRTLRQQLGMTQGEFWGRLGVMQSGGSRYESSGSAPLPVAVLAHAVYIMGVDIDARNFK